MIWLVQSRAMGALIRNAFLFVALFVFLGVWRAAACAHGFLVDGEAGLDWIHRTFLITTVYTCGSTFICNVLH